MMGSSRFLAGSFVGAVGAGYGGTVVAGMAQTAATTTSTYYALGFIPWGTTTATTFVKLPLCAILGIGAGSLVVGGGTCVAAAYSWREWTMASAAANAKMLPISVYNTSNQPITASLANDPEASLAASSNVLHRFRSWNGIGTLSCKIETNMAEELNPPTSTDDANERFLLTIDCQRRQPVHRIARLVSRGDVITFDGQTFRTQEAAQPETCWICRDDF